MTTDKKERKATVFNPTGNIERVFIKDFTNNSNLLDSSKQYRHIMVSVVFDDGSRAGLTQDWSEDEGPYIDPEDPPSALYDILEERMESLWVSTSRRSDRGLLDWMRDNTDNLDACWYLSEAKKLRSAISDRESANQRDERTAKYLTDLADEIKEQGK